MQGYTLPSPLTWGRIELLPVAQPRNFHAAPPSSVPGPPALCIPSGLLLPRFSQRPEAVQTRSWRRSLALGSSPSLQRAVWTEKGVMERPLDRGARMTADAAGMGAPPASLQAAFSEQTCSLWTVVYTPVRHGHLTWGGQCPSGRMPQPSEKNLMTA